MGNKGFFKGIITLFLFALFLFLLFAVFLLFDYIGAINVHKFIPEAIKENHIVREYLKKVNLMKLSDQDQIKELMAEQQKMYDSKISELKSIEHELEIKRAGIAKLIDKFNEKKANLASKEIEISAKEKKLKDLENEINAKKKQLELLQSNEEDYQKKIEKMAKVYEMMEPQSAAKILEQMSPLLLSDIISSMKEKSAAAILNFLDPKKSVQILKRNKIKSQEGK